MNKEILDELVEASIEKGYIREASKIIHTMIGRNDCIEKRVIEKDERVRKILKKINGLSAFESNLVSELHDKSFYLGVLKCQCAAGFYIESIISNMKNDIYERVEKIKRDLLSARSSNG